MTLAKVLARARAGMDLEREEIITLLETADPEERSQIYETAEALTLYYLGPEVHLRGLVEFSNYCTRNCNYCGLRADNHRLNRYRMTSEEIVAVAEQIELMGLKTIVLQSGEDYWYTLEMMTRIIQEIKQKTNLAITLSLGEREFTELKAWKEAGADRYLLKHETVNPDIFAEIKPDSSYEHRLGILDQLSQLGYQVGSGGMIALPGQSLTDLADDLLFIRTNKIGMAGFGPFIPHGDTPYRGYPSGSGELSLLMLAVARIVLRQVHLPATTALETLLQDGRRRALEVGANVIMPNFTPLEYRKLYEIYPNKAQTSLDEVREVILSLGRIVGTDSGDVLI